MFDCSRQANDRIETILTNLWSEDLEPGFWHYKDKIYTFKQGYGQYDGSLTGVVYEVQPDGTLKSKGSIKITPDGRVVKFPFIPMELKANPDKRDIKPPPTPIIPTQLKNYIRF